MPETYEFCMLLCPFKTWSFLFQGFFLYFSFYNCPVTSWFDIYTYDTHVTVFFFPSYFSVFATNLLFLSKHLFYSESQFLVVACYS